MCGIFGHHNQNDTELSYKSAFAAAWSNRHRGSADGFGIIDLDRKTHLRHTWTLEEIRYGKLHKARGEKATQVGAIKYVGFDEAAYKEKNDKFASFAARLVGLKSSNLLLHHRSSSFGDVKQKNTHPIPAGQTEQKALYMHNGSVQGAINVGRWLEAEEGWKFAGETDTEVIGNVIEHLLAKHGGDGEAVWNDLERVFPWFGVIIRVNGYDEVEVWKDGARPLYFYVKDGEMTYVSEPIPEIGGYTDFYYMDKGYLKIDLNQPIRQGMYDNDPRFIDYTVNHQLVREWWEEVIKKGAKVEKAKCDDCKTEKPGVLRIPFNLVKGRNSVTDICFDCWVTDGGATLHI